MIMKGTTLFYIILASVLTLLYLSFTIGYESGRIEMYKQRYSERF